MLHRCCNFVYKLKVRPSTRKEITMDFISILILLWGSGTEPAVSSRYASVKWVGHSIILGHSMHSNDGE